MAQVGTRRHFTLEVFFDPSLVRLEFVLNSANGTHIYLRTSSFSLSASLHQMLQSLAFI